MQYDEENERQFSVRSILKVDFTLKRFRLSCKVRHICWWIWSEKSEVFDKGKKYDGKDNIADNVCILERV